MRFVICVFAVLLMYGCSSVKEFTLPKEISAQCVRVKATVVNFAEPSPLGRMVALRIDSVYGFGMGAPTLISEKEIRSVRFACETVASTISTPFGVYSLPGIKQNTAITTDIVIQSGAMPEMELTVEYYQVVTQ